MTASIRRSLPPSADVGLGEAVAQQVARVVAQPEVGGGVGARVLARALGVGLDHHGQLGRDERVGPDPLAREARVLGRREVGVGAERALGGEVEHLRPERGGDHLLARHAAGVEAVEEPAHGGQRAGVVARRLRVPDADAEQEAPRVRAAQLQVLPGDVGRVVLPDVEDARGDRDLLGRLEVRAGVVERRRAAEPERAVAERLELGHDARPRLVAPPDSDPTQSHGGEA